ncbi:MAG: hypothetical protein ACYTG0_04330 [Planctomycetota bacterium]|jgi:hypothetical protein
MPPAEAPSPPIEEIPWKIHVKDKDGNLVPLLNWTLEQVLEMYDFWSGEQQLDGTPRYIIQSMTATGTVKSDEADSTSDYAEVTIEFEIWTRDKEARIPLRLPEAKLLPEGERYLGTREYRLDFEQEGAGYVVWVSGDPEKLHKLELEFLVPVKRVGRRYHLRLSAPRATSSNLTIRVPLAEAVGEVAGGAILGDPLPSQGSGTEFAVSGLNGEFELTWQKANERWPEMTPVLEAEGAIRAAIQTNGDVATTASLSVKGRGTPFDRFLVRLPKGAELLTTDLPGYSVLPVRGFKGARGTVVAEVQRDQKTLEPMEVQLSTRQPRERAGPGGFFNLGGFEVIGAVRQTGHIAVHAPSGKRVRCIPGQGVRQVDELPEALATSGVVAGYEYFGQPCSLSGRLVEVRPHVEVEPEFIVVIHRDRAELLARLRYSIRGPDVVALVADLPGWQCPKVGPDDVIDVDNVELDPSGELSIPLLEEAEGPIEVVVRAVRKFRGRVDLLSFSLPRPRADWVRPAKLLVQPADDVGLVPGGREGEGIQGLVRQQTEPPSEMSLPLDETFQQSPLFYRAETPESQFATRIKIHSRQITADVNSEIDLENGQVWQTLTFTIAHQSSDKLTIEVPRSVVGQGGLEVELADQPLLPEPVSTETEGGGSDVVRMQVVLPTARIGPCRLDVRYPCPIDLEKLDAGDTITDEVPLVMPASGWADLGAHDLHVTAPESIRVQCDTGPWKRTERRGGRLPRRNGMQVFSRDFTNRIVLKISRVDQPATVVERAWIQTWLTQDSRYERAVFQLAGGAGELELVLPDGADTRHVQLFLGPQRPEDREALKVPMTPEGHLRIPLRNGPTPPRQWLEVRYAFAGQRQQEGRLSLELPHLTGNVWFRQTYWQLVLPRNEHVIVEPEGLTPEYRWAWNGCFWGRKPVLEQSELEAWCGAESLTAVPKAANRYLFSNLGPVAGCTLRTARRWMIVLGASLPVLAAGLFLIYVPACRHPAVLLVAAVGLLAAGLLYPEPTLLAAQAASLGMALALVAALLRWTVGRRRRDLRPWEASSSVLFQGSTQALRRPPIAASQGSTEAAPVSMPTPTPDSES